MEYAYFPSYERAAKLVIVADEEPDEKSIEYLKFIREKFKLPVYYSALDMESGKLSEEF